MKEQKTEYKAFISYRHRDFDRKVAIQLQKMLETYHIPKKLGKKEQWKVFRDETELPASDDLSEDIQTALRKSEFLIVICSTATAESKWCRQEIAYFKSLHQNTTKKICTVLIEGDPDKVFPEELCRSEIEQPVREASGTEAAESGQSAILSDTQGKTTRRITIEVEPLAANITADSEKASLKKLKSEFLRIAAPMLGVTYDTLKQRQRTYRYQKVTAAAIGAAVIAVLFSAYAYRQNAVISGQAAQITEEYTKNLISQAKYYTKEAKDLLQNNNIVGAVERLLLALSDEENDRPVTADAVRTLTDALQLYTAPWNAENTATPVKSLDLPYGLASDFLMDEDGTYVIVAGDGRIEVRRADTLELVQTIQLSGSISRSSLTDYILLKNDHTLIYAIRNEIHCVDYLTGKEIWKNTDTVPEDTAEWNIALSDDKKTFVFVCMGTVYTIDADTGETLTEMTYDSVENPEIKDSLDPEKVQDPGLGSVLVVSEDGKKAAFVSQQWETESGYYTWTSHVYIADLEQQKVAVLDTEFPLIEAMTLTEDGQLYIMTDTTIQFDYGDRQGVFAGKTTVSSWDLSTGELRWKKEADTENISDSFLSKIVVEVSPYPSHAGNMVLAEYGNRIMMLDAGTGDIIENLQYDRPLTKVSFDGQQISTVLENGSCVWHTCTEQTESPENVMVSRKAFAEDVVKTIAKQQEFYVLCKNEEAPAGYTLYRYQIGRSDERYQTITTQADAVYYASAGHGWQYALENDEVYLLDCKTGTQYEISLPAGCGDTDMKYFGMAADGSVCWLTQRSWYGKEPAIYAVYLDSQEIKKITIPLEKGETLTDLVTADKTIYYLATKAVGEAIDYTDQVTPGKDGRLEEKDAYVVEPRDDTMMLYSWIPETGAKAVVGSVALEKGEDTIVFIDTENKKSYGSVNAIVAVENYVDGSLTVSESGELVSWNLYTDNAKEDGTETQKVRCIQADTVKKNITNIEPEMLQTEAISSAEEHVLNADGTVEAVLYSASYSSKDGDAGQKMRIKAYTSAGKELSLPEKENEEPSHIFFTENKGLLWILYKNTENTKLATLVAYDPKTQTTVAELALDESYWISEDMAQLTDTAFLLYGGDYGYIIDETYLSTGGILARISDCEGCDGTTIYVSHTDSLTNATEWGSFPYATVDELIQMGKNFM